MNKSITRNSLRAAILSWMAATAASTDADAAVRTVSGSFGLDTLGGGMMGGPNDCILIACATIAHAVSQAAPGDVVQLQNGPFNQCNISINKSITVRGPATIDAAGQCRHFNISSAFAADVSLTNLTLINGFATQGGSILNNASGHLVLANVQIVNGAATDGGGVYNGGGVVTLTSSTLTSNLAHDRGGAVFSEGGVINIEGGSLRENVASAAGGALYATGASVAITDDSLLEGNDSDLGGGVFALSSELAIEDSAFAHNAANTGAGLFASAGAATVKTTVFDANNAELHGGGAYLNNGVTATVASSDFTDNSAGSSGGAVYVGLGAALTARDDLFAANHAQLGGAVFDRTGAATATSLRRSAFVENTAVNDGGAYHYEGVVGAEAYVVNVTFSGNAAQRGAAVFNTGDGALALTHTTLYGNAATNQGVIYNQNTAADLVLDDSILKANIGGDCYTNPTTLAASAVVGRGNLSDNCGSGGLFNLGVATNVSPTLAFYGRQPVHAVLAGSNAVDNARGDCIDPDPGKGSIELDQRGQSRPNDGDGDGVQKCDIGAFEKMATPTAEPATGYGL